MGRRLKIAQLLQYSAVRFVIVGIISNGTLYLAYLYLTSIGVESKTAMTFLYVVGVVQGFVFNKKWTFSHSGFWVRTFLAYVLLYAVGYIMNLAALHVLVDRLHLPHAPVQALAMIVLAGFFFISQQLLIFARNDVE